MIQLTVVAAVVAVLGGAVAVSARDTRIVALGRLLAMVTAPLASAPEPPSLAIAFRFLGALLAAYLLWAAARVQSVSSEGSGVGPTAEIAVAAAAFSIGWFVVPVKPLAGPVAAQAAGISLAALAVMPLAGRNVLRAGAGVAVLVVGISLLLEAWVGPATPLQQIALTALLVGIIGATSVLMSPLEPGDASVETANWETGEQDLTQAADQPPDAIGPRPQDGPAPRSGAAPRVASGAVPRAASRAPSRAAPRASRPAAAAPIEAPVAAPVAAPTRASASGASRAGASTPRSPRAIRRAAPAGSIDVTTSVDEVAPGPPAPPAAATPASGRVRRMHPREPQR